MTFSNNNAAWEKKQNKETENGAVYCLLALDREVRDKEFLSELR